MTADLRTLAQAVVIARNNYGWSPEADDAIHALRAELARHAAAAIAEGDATK